MDMMIRRRSSGLREEKKAMHNVTHTAAGSKTDAHSSFSLRMLICESQAFAAVVRNGLAGYLKRTEIKKMLMKNGSRIFPIESDGGNLRRGKFPLPL